MTRVRKLYSFRRTHQDAKKQAAAAAAEESESSDDEGDQQCVGYFKGIINIETNEDKAAYKQEKTEIIEKLKQHINNLSIKITGQPYQINTEALVSSMERKKFETQVRKLGLDHMDISDNLVNLNADDILRKALLQQTKCKIKVYMISGFDMSSRDNGSASDTYLTLECNGRKFNERDNYQLDEPNPVFYKMYQFEGIFPGSSPLTISVWDYDMVFGDELVGTTMVDLEDRYFSVEWNALHDKPIEYRQLYHPSSQMS